MTAQDQPMWAPSARPDLGSFVPRERRTGPLLLWLGSLALAVAALLWLGDGGLAAPDLTDPGTWSTWAGERDVATVVVVVLRIVGLALAWYLLGVTTVSVLAHAARSVELVRVADALSFGPVRALVQQALGLSLAVGVVATQLPTHATVVGHVGARDTVAAERSDGLAADASTPAGTITSDTVAVADDTVARHAPVPAPADRASGAVEVGSPDPAIPPDPVVDDEPASIGDGRDATPRIAAPARPVPDGADQGVSREVRVVAGDHLWSIAAADLGLVLGRDPSDAEVATHWQRVIEANRDRLVVPDNPDLLHPGQLLVLPEVEVGS